MLYRSAIMKTLLYARFGLWFRGSHFSTNSATPLSILNPSAETTFTEIKNEMNTSDRFPSKAT